MNTIRIIVATHKKYRMPQDDIYIPLHVGAEIDADEDGAPNDFGYVKDNTGDNISIKNRNFCELTGLYWAWKNVDADWLGLVHYRRHFMNPGRRIELIKSAGRKYDKFDYVIRRDEVDELIRKTDVLLPRKRHYLIESNFKQYAHAHHAADLEITREIISEKYPDYLPAFDRAMKRRSLHLFNMFIMKRDIINAYCEWLFDILFELETRLDIAEYSENDARVFGYVAERMLDPWIQTNNISYQEIPYLYMEHQNWIVKGGRFIGRHFRPTNG